MIIAIFIYLSLLESAMSLNAVIKVKAGSEICLKTPTSSRYQCRQAPNTPGKNYIFYCYYSAFEENANFNSLARYFL